MVENQIISRGIQNPTVINAMINVKRHIFVPEKYLDSAYNDNPIPIKSGQTVSQPYMVALMTELVDPKSGKKVLEIGTGSGYQTAVLADSGCNVYTIEVVEGLALKARKLLEKLGYFNIKFKIGDGYKGWQENAPYDAIIVTAAPIVIPDILIDQLSLGGRLIIPSGKTTQDLLLLQKTADGIERKRITSVRFVPMTKS